LQSATRLAVARALPTQRPNWRPELALGLLVAGARAIPTPDSDANRRLPTWRANLTEAKAREAGARLVNKSDLMANSDAVSVHMVLSPRSRGIIGAEDIARMKQGAILINTSRGPLIDEYALITAVKAGRIIAALDVYDKEPLPQDHPFRVSDHTVLTPHLGYGVAETWRDFYPRSIENAEAFLDGKSIRVLNAS
jgi:phosphoglycerate dehydrogenase-like enzyme